MIPFNKFYNDLLNLKENYNYTQKDINNIINKYKNNNDIKKYKISTIYYNYTINKIINLFDSLNEFIIFITFNNLDNIIFTFKHESYNILQNIQKICKLKYNINNNINDIFNSIEYKVIIIMYNFYNNDDKFKNDCIKNIDNKYKYFFYKLLY